MDNLKIYDGVKTVPNEAKKSIAAGRLKGMTDINPMWRIKTLTEQFGPVGFGWYYEITKQEIVEASDNQKVAFVNINLFVKYKDEWSKPIEGTGGSSFISNERKGMYTSDECFKMALTDAISVACKALGVGASVYWQKGESKYSPNNSNSSSNNDNTSNSSNNSKEPLVEEKHTKAIFAVCKAKGITEQQLTNSIKKDYKKNDKKDLTMKEFRHLMDRLNKLKDKEVK